MSLGVRFDAWVMRGPFTAADLRRYRVIYAASALLLLPRPEGLSQLPAFLWKPPMGPFEVVSQPPPHTVLLAVTTVEIVALALLLVGVLPRIASLAAGLTFIIADGLSHSYGTIHHYVLLGVVPLVLCWTGWGRRAEPPQWPMRLMALIIGVAFGTAGIAKLRAGWLDTSTQSTRAHFLHGYLMGGEDRFAAPLAARIDSTVLWELLDWSTVILELAVLVTVISWTWFRRTLLAIVAFHLGVLLVLNIAFAANVVAYGAFVRWSRWWPDAGRRRREPAALLAVGTAAAAASWLVAAMISPTAELYVKASFVVAGAVVAATICASQRLRPLASTTSSE